MSAGGWTDREDARLRQLWSERVSTADIGRILGRTKNSVVGRAHRMGLPPRVSPIRGDGATVARVPVAPRAPEATLGGTAATAPVRVAEAAPAPLMVAPRVSVPPGRCRFPLWGDQERPTHRYCDAPRARGIYCAAHADRCYAERAA